MIHWIKVKTGVYRSECGHYEVAKEHGEWVGWDKRGYICVREKTARDAKGLLEGRARSRAKRFAIANETLRKLVPSC